MREFFRIPDITDLNQIPCIKRECGSSDSIISDTDVEEVAPPSVGSTGKKKRKRSAGGSPQSTGTGGSPQSTTPAIKLQCSKAGHYLEGENFEAVTELEASCSNKIRGKLPVWKIDGTSLQDSADIVCKDGSKCVNLPPSFGNSLLLSDFDGEVHDNGTTFKLVCPTNQTGPSFHLLLI